MRIKIALLIPLLCCLLAACVDVEVRTTVHKGGSGLQKWSFSTTALLAGEIKKQVQNDPLLKNGRITADDFKEGNYHLQVEIPFETVRSLKQPGHEIALEQSGLFRKRMVYRESWTSQVLRGSSLLGTRAQGVLPINVKVAVEMPGKITATNSDMVEGSVAYWNVPLSDLTEAMMLEVESVYWNTWLIIVLAAVFALSLLALLLLVAFASRKGPAPNTGGVHE